jgi:hypothetical protein
MLKYLKSRTTWLHLIMMGLAMLNAYLELIADPAYYAAWFVLYGNIGVWLRKLTTKPLEKL